MRTTWTPAFAGVTILLLPMLSLAQESASFLKIGVGARPIGMGGAYTAVADDINAIAWNPAGLAAIGKREFGFMHAEMFANTHYDFFGYGQATRAGTFALGATHLSQGAIDGRDASGHPTGSFSAADTAVDLAYASRFSSKMQLGGGLKYIKSSIADASAQTYALDLGGIYALERLGPGVPQLGFAVQNLGPGMRFLDQSSPLPLTFTTGLGYRLPVGLTLAVDYARHPYEKSSDISFGTEYALLSAFSIRAGYASTASSPQGGTGVAGLRGLAGGFGVKAYGYSLDYSLTPMGELGNVHRISLDRKF